MTTFPASIGKARASTTTFPRSPGSRSATKRCGQQPMRCRQVGHRPMVNARKRRLQPSRSTMSNSGAPRRKNQPRMTTRRPTPVPKPAPKPMQVPTPGQAPMVQVRMMTPTVQERATTRTQVPMVRVQMPTLVRVAPPPTVPARVVSGLTVPTTATDPTPAGQMPALPTPAPRQTVQKRTSQERAMIRIHPGPPRRVGMETCPAPAVGLRCPWPSVRGALALGATLFVVSRRRRGAGLS